MEKREKREIMNKKEEREGLKKLKRSARKTSLPKHEDFLLVCVRCQPCHTLHGDVKRDLDDVMPPHLSLFLSLSLSFESTKKNGKYRFIQLITIYMA